MSKLRNAHEKFADEHPILRMFLIVLTFLIIAFVIASIVIATIWNLTPEQERNEIIAAQNYATQTHEHHKQMLIEHFGEDNANQMSVIVDQTNGVTYILCDAYHERTMTALLDADGKPHIDEDWLAQHSHN